MYGNKRDNTFNGIKKTHGFSLLELLVVLVIIGIFSSMIVLSLGNNFSRELRTEAERLQSLLIAAADEAIFIPAELGVLLEKSQYTLVRFDPIAQAWAPYATQAFKPHALPDSMQMQWEIEGFSRRVLGDDGEYDIIESEEITFGADEVEFEDLQDEADTATAQVTLAVSPQILLLSSGEMTAFTVRFLAAEGIQNAELLELSSDGFSMPNIKTPAAPGDAGFDAAGL